eukprot:6200523-Pleurochrysis_carterae.AAC.3
MSVHSATRRSNCLHVGCAGIGDEVCKAFAESFKLNQALTRIDLSGLHCDQSSHPRLLIRRRRPCLACFRLRPRPVQICLHICLQICIQVAPHWATRAAKR